MTKADEYEEVKRRNENFDRICTNKQIKQIDKILAKENDCNEVDMRISEVRSHIKQATADNIKIANEVKR